jgi:large-conductance mechanosensitive channel
MPFSAPLPNPPVIAVGLVMALFFAQIINAILEGIIMPLIAAIFDEENLREYLH